jgi:hypothetical protein
MIAQNSRRGPPTDIDTDTAQPSGELASVAGLRLELPLLSYVRPLFSVFIK